MEERHLQELKQIELEILLKVDEVCNALGVSYFLDAGTVLGAARHQGFIPWDDDIDIGMLRSHYEHFLAEAQPLLGDQYFLQTRHTDPLAPFPFAKVRKNHTCLKELAVSDLNIHHGVWIDIFPYDYVRTGRWHLRRKRAIQKLLWRAYVLRTWPKADLKQGLMKSLVKRAARSLVRTVPDGLCQDGINCLGDKVATGEPILITSFQYASGAPSLQPADVFPLGKLTFEGYDFPVVHNYRKYLAQVYGDWQTLPPLSERSSHAVTEYFW